MPINPVNIGAKTTPRNINSKKKPIGENNDPKCFNGHSGPLNAMEEIHVNKNGKNTHNANIIPAAFLISFCNFSPLVRIYDQDTVHKIHNIKGPEKEDSPDCPIPNKKLGIRRLCVLLSQTRPLVCS
jgi:hypothetical protein